LHPGVEVWLPFRIANQEEEGHWNFGGEVVANMDQVGENGDYEFRRDGFYEEYLEEALATIFCIV
jgi:hypothetical protein